MRDSTNDSQPQPIRYPNRSTAIINTVPMNVVYRPEQISPALLSQPNTVSHLHGSVREPATMIMTTATPAVGGRLGVPYHHHRPVLSRQPIQQDYIRPAGRSRRHRLAHFPEIPFVAVFGWHLNRSAAELLRHAQVATTMNVYGDALITIMRGANSKVVQTVLRRELKAAK
jgi:hypothetical protein